MERGIGIGRGFIAIALCAFGVQHVVLGRFVTRLVPGLPAWMPAQAALAWFAGAVLIGASLALVFDRKHRRALALALGALILLSFLAVHVPQLVGVRQWTSALKCLSLAGGVLAIAAASPPAPAVALDRWLLALARVSLAVFMIFSCVMHFLFPQFVATLVPRWIPGATFWTYFSAIALFAGGLGLLLPPVRRVAAALSAAMIFSWVIVLHLPRALTMRNANETTALFEALAFSGLALIIASVPVQREAAVPAPA
jgi:uncharacterized membrane protein